jgi:hypothetical protein
MSSATRLVQEFVSFFLATGVSKTLRLALVYGNRDKLMKGMKTPKRHLPVFREMPFRFQRERIEMNAHGLKNSGTRV